MYFFVCKLINKIVYSVHLAIDNNPQVDLSTNQGKCNLRTPSCNIPRMHSISIQPNIFLHLFVYLFNLFVIFEHYNVFIFIHLFVCLIFCIVFFGFQ